ncbi:MAG: hypothetical protein CMK09_18060 [Ponticaulis sp.]|nr:hypothetical protein [Ponticaulis sp.]|tara:strand:- start:37974 stop:38912 length:939 start_codon:yes stop_codon:yes gene_type:complete
MSAQNEWQTYWRGRNDVPQDRRHRLLGDKYDAELDAFWRGVLSGLPESTRMVDLACGSGATVKAALALGFEDVTGVDISPDAIEMLKDNCPGAKGVAAPLDEMPFEDGAFDLVTSQFGFEYAGALDRAEDIASLVAADGQFVALVHMQEGGIARECEAARAEAQAFDEIGFIPVAQKFFKVLTQRDVGLSNDQALNDAMQAQDGPRSKLVELGHTGHPLAQHAIQGAGWFFENRANTPLTEIIDWFETIDRENKAHMARMEGMLSAALSKAEAEAFLTKLEGQGMDTETVKPFQPFETEPPVGWILRARRRD